MPQIVGGAEPPGFVIEKESVKHWLANEHVAGLGDVKTPFLQAPSTASVSDPVEGPEMTKVSKSSLNLKNHFDKKKLELKMTFLQK